MFDAHIDRAAQQRASVQRFVDYPVKISGSAAELVHLGHTTSEVLKPFCGAASRQGLIGAVQPDTMEIKTLKLNCKGISTSEWDLKHPTKFTHTE